VTAPDAWQKRGNCVGTYQTRVDDGVVSVLLPATRAQVEAEDRS
jgi:hypothetical protein